MPVVQIIVSTLLAPKPLSCSGEVLGVVWVVAGIQRREMLINPCLSIEIIAYISCLGSLSFYISIVSQDRQ